MIVPVGKLTKGELFIFEGKEFVKVTNGVWAQYRNSVDGGLVTFNRDTPVTFLAPIETGD